MRTWLKNLLGRTEPASSTAPEADVADDPAVSRARPAGGRPGDGSGDDRSSTGPEYNDPVVGRISGDDLGYTGEMGAERRAEE